MSAALAALGTIAALLIWPAVDRGSVEHSHADLPADHPHLVQDHADGMTAHAFVIDQLHPTWPK